MSGEENYESLLNRFAFVFSPPFTDLYTKVLAAIDSNLTVDCAHTLADRLLSAAVTYPHDVDAIVLPIANALPQRADILVTDSGYTNESFPRIVKAHLGDLLGDILNETDLHKPKQTEVSPSNRVLAGALFSGSSVKNHLFDTGLIYWFARKGLMLLDEPVAEERQEVVSLGTCLQLLVMGDVMVEKGLRAGVDLPKIVEALEALRENKVVQNARGIQLLERTIAAAKARRGDSLNL
ncbi:hypothetical protein NLJ89_g6140 [Agrocybe chaxingu]|uniref:Uncharacterized protein n=1 Tax=Agrocybe chaxingu TaxID=84603 RepID=A0A9W8MSZ4_9AGAR|nr:hypothetical protein NLJ89_g6140 [Agrocybe chaxingu]